MAYLSSVLDLKRHLISPQKICWQKNGQFCSNGRIGELEFTKRAIKEIEKITQSENGKKYFRITVQGGGCSGFKYSFSFDKKAEKDDVLFNHTIIDKFSLDIIAGSTIDFKKEMIGESFVIDNPKASASCGCGLSFSV